MGEGATPRVSLGPVTTWAISLGLGLLAGIFTAGARVQAVQDRVMTLEREHTRVEVGAEEFRRQVLEQLRRLEVALAEVRAEQRILHARP